MKQTLSMVDGRPTLRFERHLQHPLEKVWRALTEPDELAGWFPATVRIHDLRLGGRLEFVFPQGEAPTLEGVITELVPRRVFAYSWGDQQLRFTLELDDGGCVLTFTHAFGDRLDAAAFAAGWHQCLDSLGDSLDGREISPATRHAELHERYVRAFSLTQAGSRPHEGGWLLTVERPLASAPGQVWAALAGGTVVGGPPPASATVDAVGAAIVITAETGKTLEYRWTTPAGAEERVRWDLEPGPGGTRALLTHFTTERPDEVLAAWRRQVATLAGPVGEGTAH
jgi:uncharacterized protein YndB with AHSA1/START domain